MNLINIDFEREKNDIKWNIIMIIYSILFLFCLILIIIFRVNPEISGMDKFALQEEFVENVIKEIAQKIVMDEEKKKEQVKNRENSLKSEDRRIIQEKSSPSNVNEEKNKNNSNQINDEEQMINALNVEPPSDLKEGEELINVIFQIPDESENLLPITCKKNLIFNQVEKLLYEKVLKLKETNNIFLCNGKPVDKIKTLEENNIKHQQIVSIICKSNGIKNN